MTPYLKLQLVYVLITALVVFALDFAVGRAPRLARRPCLRVLVVAALIAVEVVAWIVAVKYVDDTHSTYQFIAIAFGFYAGVLFVPLLGLVRAKGERWFAAACVAALALGQYALWIEPNRLVESRYALTFSQWPADAPPLRLVHISDLQTVGECAREREAASRIVALEPDLIVITGDYIAGPFSDPTPAIDAARKFLIALGKPRLGIVCVAGHSESEALRARVFEGLDVRYLRDEELEIALGNGRRLRILGARTQGLDVSKLARRAEPGLVTLVATHEPDVSWDLDGKHVDLHLAGHTHGGQIALPWFGPPLMLSTVPRRFARGLHTFGDHLIHVNPGIGMEGDNAPRMRINCPPEIDLLLLGGGGVVRASEPVPERS